ncbi:toprim domain-containing protein [Salmonella enterica subsp. enterica serovar Abaetetuba]|nr:toprim domain-containing protein [Salmonella enterica subsp. enterica serovar Abaetetuba]ECD1969234.1 toprim domain-containing protein [Salmonella enterica subsp. enterica serovar Abaetetuba]EJR4301079.1 toprim domain-containing protein [Salmonella enterica]EJR4404573.1 toprim domain-containing protein [Salmonella enterica]
MARIPAHELDELKRHANLLSLAQSQGHKFKKHGADSYVCLCPFHSEKTPSCVITPAKGLYHCFGCGAKGSVIDWQMNTTGQGLRDAVAFLKARLAGAEDTPSSLAVSPVEPKAMPARQLLVDLDADGQALLRQVTDFYHHNLLDSPEAQAWLAHRGLNHPELVSHFRLGFAGKHGVSGDAGLLPSPASKEGRRLRERLSALGVLREQTRQDHFRGCVMMPVEGWSESATVAHRGRILQLYGRRTQPDYKILKDSPRHLYLPSPLCGVWNEAAMPGASDIILCESLIDAMTFWCAGLRNVTTAYGVNGFTSDHLAALRYHGVKRVLIAYDRDEAGDRGAESVAAELLACGLEAWRVPFPPGMDANEYALKSGSPEAALGLALQQAQWLGQGSGPGVVFSHESSPLPDSVTTTAPDNRPSLAVSASAPVAATTDIVAHEVNASGDLLLTSGPRVWRVRGWQKQRQPETMKVNVQVRDSLTGAFHVDSLDMYHARSRQSYISTAATELACESSVIRRECGRLLLLLEQKQDEARQSDATDSCNAVTMSTEDEAAALALLKSPDLATRITDDLAACGVVGESTNLLTGYLAAVSRKLDKPLAVLIQSSSAAGKSSLMDAVLGLMPDEERVQYSAMTGQSLYYLGETSLQHKILAIAEEEGVRQAAYALKLLQSDGALTIASTGKNEQSGELVTREYSVQGPVMLMLTTTAIDVDEELLNRCLVLTVNESREQTQAIHAMQRHGQTLEGLLAQSEKQYLTQLHQNAQRLLRPLKVVNPYAHQLTFLSDKTRTRRDHMKYLTLIQAAALLHQYQREVKRATHRGQVIEYIEVTKDDIALATKLAHEVLGRTLDEMPPQTRKLLLLIQGMVREMADRQQCLPGEVRFTRRDIRASTGWSDSQLKNHCVRLVEMEYLLLHGGSRGHLLHYELLWDGDSTQTPHLCGLPDVECLTNATSKAEGGERRSAPEGVRSGTSPGQVCPLSGAEQTTPGHTVQGPEAISGAETENAVNSNKIKTPPSPTARSHPDSTHAAVVTHG